MTQTLTRERKQKFEAILIEEGIYPTSREDRERIINKLAEASLSRSERKMDEGKGEYEPNIEVMRGDWREYPEHLHETARVLRDIWKFVLPHKPQKGNKEKSSYKMFIVAMEQIKQNCGEFPVTDVLTKLYTKWKSEFKDGIAPYTIAQPTSLINVTAGIARDMRDSAPSSTTDQVIKVDETGKPETY